MLNLKQKISKEFNNVNKIVAKTEQILNLISKINDHDYYDPLIMALTLCLENFYMGIERTFSFIAKEIDGVIPSSENWHIKLLRQMSIEIPAIRPAVISQETYDLLNNFRGFRHVARNLYVYDLDAKRIIEIGNQVDLCYQRLSQDIERFNVFLSSEELKKQ